MCPSPSYSTQEKSRASLMTGETAVLMIADDISCVTCWSRWRITSSVTGSTRSAIRDLDGEVAAVLHARALARTQQDRRVGPLDERGTGERHAGSEGFAVVQRDAERALGVREPDDARSARHRRCARRRHG